LGAPHFFRFMKLKPNQNISLVALAALLVVWALWPFPNLLSISGEHLVGVLVLVVIAFFSDALPFKGAPQLGTSVAFLPFLACIVIFEPDIAVPAITTAVIASNIFPTRRALNKAIFNVSQAIVSAGVAALLYDQIVKPNAPLTIGPFLLMTVVLLATNMLLVSIVVHSMKEQRFAQVMSDVFGPRGGGLVNGILASPLALFIALAFDRLGVTGIVAVLLPLLFVRYAAADKMQLRRANKDLLKVLIKAIETRDPYTSGHSLRVATLAVAIAEDLKLPQRRIEEVEIAALLHDVGKIDSSFSAVIRKPYDLSEEERALIQTHAALGADLLLNLKSVPLPIVNAVRHHHERMDGTGYPAGLKGDVIPLPARIIMLCDSIDAMLSDRPYRKALPLDRVRQELVRCSGDQFDPEIVKVILQKDTLTKAVRLIETVSGFEDEYLIRAHG
jgi:putative nucleotidyltransferase with HDIG domain